MLSKRTFCVRSDTLDVETKPSADAVTRTTTYLVVGDDKYVVRGQTQAGEYVQVIYVFEADAHIDYEGIDLAAYDAGAENVYVIHARPLEDDEKRNFRK